MAVLSEAQQDVIDQLNAARVVYDQFELELRKEVADRKWAARAETRRLVRKAREMNVPMRQVGIALETSDHKTLKDYENDVRRN